MRADSMLDASTALAVHFGTLQQGDDAEREPVDSLDAALVRSGCRQRFWSLRNGESRLVPTPSAVGQVPSPGTVVPGAMQRTRCPE